MSIQLDPFSRFFDTDPIIVDGVETFGLWQRPYFLDRSQLENDDIIEFTVLPQYAGKPDLIAFEVYDSALLDWVVVMFNNPRETLNWPLSNSIIQLPRADIVLPEVL